MIFVGGLVGVSSVGVGGGGAELRGSGMGWYVGVGVGVWIFFAGRRFAQATQLAWVAWEKVAWA